MKKYQLFKDLTACFQAALGAFHATEMRTAESWRKSQGVTECAAALFEKTTGQKSLEITPAQERVFKRELLVASGAAGKNPYIGWVTSDDILKARDRIFDDALKAGLVRRAPAKGPA